MPKRSSKNPEDEDRNDVNVRAFEIVQKGTSEEPVKPQRALSEIIERIRQSDEDADALADKLWPRIRALAASEMGRRGGKKGGKARKQKLSAERRSEIAREAARKRWAASGGDEQ